MLKKYWLLLIVVIIFCLPLIPARAEDVCVWREHKVTSGAAGGTAVFQQAGGCFSSVERQVTGADESKCSSPKPEGSSLVNANGITTKITPVCCCRSESNFTAPKFIIPDIQITIPGLSLSPTSSIVKDQDLAGNYRVEIPWIAEYIKGLYDYGLSIAGIIAALVLMGGGLLWLISGGDASKMTQAKEMIIGSVTGLVILASSYIILVQINPELTRFKAISLGGIKHEEFDPPEGNLQEEQQYGGTTRKATNRIVVHTAAGLGTRNDIDKYHKSLGWKGIGYNVYIERDGRAVMGRGEDAVGAHSISYNMTSLGISYSGCAEKNQWNNKTLKQAVDNGTITQAQLDALIERIKHYQQKYNIPRDKVIGHYEEPVAKACPCLPMDELRSKLNP